MRTLVLLVALVVGAGVVAAAPPSPGMQLYQAGERAFHQQKWEEARRSFAAAYELDRKPELLYDVALATWRLAREDETVESLRAARAAYQRYLDLATAGRRRKPAEEALAQIDAQLPKPQPAKPAIVDEDDDPARPLDPYTPRKLPPIPKPIIIGKPAPQPVTTPAKTPTQAQPRRDSGDDEVPPRGPNEPRSSPAQSKPVPGKPKLPAHNPNLPKGMIEVGAVDAPHASARS